MKTKLLTLMGIVLFGTGAIAQQNMAGRVRCSSTSPSKDWDAMFNKMVEQYKSDHANARLTSSSYVIPIVFHIIYNGSVAEGTYPNIAQSLITSQVSILNADYAGTGYSTNQWSTLTLNGHAAFYDYAVANSLTAPDNAGVAPVNTGITFCLATKDASGSLLAEPGIDRVNCATQSPVFTDPGTIKNTNSFMSYMDGTIKPATIWDPTRYFNVWISDASQQNGILGYSSFPMGTTLSGLSGGGSTSASASTDGCWVLASSVGNSGTANAPYNLGRTLTHESGHYFGLRHVWGDGDCLTDYCNDTPGAEGANYYGEGTGNTTYTYPYHVGTCTSEAGMENGTDGEMYMAFMDYSDDQFMMMFTNDELTRMLATLTQSPDRMGLNASAATLCASTASVQNNVDLGSSVTIFPNPSAGMFTINMNFEKQANAAITVTNVLGQVLLTDVEQNIVSHTLNMDLSNYSKGNYFVTVRSNEGVITKRIVISD